MDKELLKNIIIALNNEYPNTLFNLDTKFPFLQTQNIKKYKEILSKYENIKLLFGATSELLYMYNFLKDHTIEEYIEIRICSYCHIGMNKFINYNKGYHRFCSTKCSRNSPLSQERYKKTLLEKYGNETFNNSEKNKQTCLERYGCENVFQREEIKEKSKQTKLEKYNDPHYVNFDKRKQTCLIKYGFESPLSNKEIQNKIRNIMLEKYGVRTPMEVEEFKLKHQQNMMKKYNTTNPLFVSVNKHYKNTRKKFAEESFVSKNENNWLEFLNVKNDIEHRQFLFGKYSMDGYVYEDGHSKIVFEFLGDFWHGHPSLIKKQPAYESVFIERFNKTLEKFKYLFDNKFVVIYIWEHDWKYDRYLFGRVFDGNTLEWDDVTDEMNYPLYQYPFGKYPHHTVENPYLQSLSELFNCDLSLLNPKTVDFILNPTNF